MVSTQVEDVQSEAMWAVDQRRTALKEAARLHVRREVLKDAGAHLPAIRSLTALRCPAMAMRFALAAEAAKTQEEICCSRPAAEQAQSPIHGRNVVLALWPGS